VGFLFSETRQKLAFGRVEENKKQTAVKRFWVFLWPVPLSGITGGNPATAAKRLWVFLWPVPLSGINAVNPATAAKRLWVFL